MNFDTKFAVVATGCSLGLGLALYFGYKRFYGCRRKPPYIGGVVKQLHVFPVKSLGGFQMDSMEMEKYGPKFDRNWVLLNAKGILQTQRQIPKMALIQTSIENDEYLCFDAPGMTRMKVKIDIEDDESQRVMFDLFEYPVQGQYCGDEVSQWFDSYLGKTGLGLYTGRNKGLKKRRLRDNPVWGDVVKDGDETPQSFHDAPVLLISEASVEALNKKLEKPCGILTFRPNIVVKGCRAHEEDSWNTIMIGDALFRKVRLQLRCILTIVDYTKDEKRTDNEPLATLKRDYQCKTGDKRYGDAPLFGVLYVMDKLGTAHVGDDVIVIN